MKKETGERTNTQTTSDLGKSENNIYHTPVVNLVKKTCYTVYICYDDGCHLKRYATHPEKCNQTETAEKIAGLNIVVDKLHFKGHVDAWCKENCNPYTCKDLDNVSLTATLVHVINTNL